MHVHIDLYKLFEKELCCGGDEEGWKKSWVPIETLKKNATDVILVPMSQKSV